MVLKPVTRMSAAGRPEASLPLACHRVPSSTMEARHRDTAPTDANEAPADSDGEELFVEEDVTQAACEAEHAGEDTDRAQRLAQAIQATCVDALQRRTVRALLLGQIPDPDARDIVERHLTPALLTTLAATHLCMGLAPRLSDIFRWFPRHVAAVRVVIVGQDPYPSVLPGTAGGPACGDSDDLRDAVPVADGVAFSSAATLQPSLGHLLYVAQNTPCGTSGGSAAGSVIGDSGAVICDTSLAAWTEQRGVVMTNATLSTQLFTTRAPHRALWEPMMRDLLAYICARAQPHVVLCSFGAHAAQLCRYVRKRLYFRHALRVMHVRSAHPSGRGRTAQDLFGGCRTFALVNAYRRELGVPPIDWSIPPGAHDGRTAPDLEAYAPSDDVRGTLTLRYDAAAGTFVHPDPRFAHLHTPFPERWGRVMRDLFPDATPSDTLRLFLYEGWVMHDTHLVFAVGRNGPGQKFFLVLPNAGHACVTEDTPEMRARVHAFCAASVVPMACAITPLGLGADMDGYKGHREAPLMRVRFPYVSAATAFADLLHALRRPVMACSPRVVSSFLAWQGTTVGLYQWVDVPMRALHLFHAGPPSLMPFLAVAPTAVDFTVADVSKPERMASVSVDVEFMGVTVRDAQGRIVSTRYQNKDGLDPMPCVAASFSNASDPAMPNMSAERKERAVVMPCTMLVFFVGGGGGAEEARQAEYVRGVLRDGAPPTDDAAWRAFDMPTRLSEHLSVTHAHILRFPDELSMLACYAQVVRGAVATCVSVITGYNIGPFDMPRILKRIDVLQNAVKGAPPGGGARHIGVLATLTPEERARYVAAVSAHYTARLNAHLSRCHAGNNGSPDWGVGGTPRRPGGNAPYAATREDVAGAFDIYCGGRGLLPQPEAPWSDSAGGAHGSIYLFTRKEAELCAHARGSGGAGRVDGVRALGPLGAPLVATVRSFRPPTQMSAHDTKGNKKKGVKQKQLRVTATLDGLDGAAAMIDMLPFCRTNEQASSYTLDSMAKHILGDIPKVTLTYGLLAMMYERGSALLEAYVGDDAVVAQALLNQKRAIAMMGEYATATGLSIGTLMARGQRVRGSCIGERFGLDMRRYQEYVPADFEWNDAGDAVADDKDGGVGYEGGAVVPSLRGVYKDPIATLDYASLYPSVMRAFNLCTSAEVKEEDAAALRAAGVTVIEVCSLESAAMDQRARAVEEYRKHESQTATMQVAATVAAKCTPITAFFGTTEAARRARGVDVSASAASSDPGADDFEDYLHRFTTSTTLAGGGASTAERAQYRSMPTVLTAADPGALPTDTVSRSLTPRLFVAMVKNAVVPRGLESLGNRRKVAKRAMDSPEALADPALRQCYNQRQDNMKRFMNSMYGEYGCDTRKMHLAAAVTAMGRSMLNKAIEEACRCVIVCTEREVAPDRLPGTRWVICYVSRGNAVRSYCAVGCASDSQIVFAETVLELSEAAVAAAGVRARYDMKVVYGDTDSIFVRMRMTPNEHERSSMYAFRQCQHASQWLATHITARIAAWWAGLTGIAPEACPISLASEKASQLGILVAKKMYELFTSEGLDPPKIKIKGLAQVRRDTPAYIRTIYSLVTAAIVAYVDLWQSPSGIAPRLMHAPNADGTRELTPAGRAAMATVVRHMLKHGALPATSPLWPDAIRADATPETWDWAALNTLYARITATRTIELPWVVAIMVVLHAVRRLRCYQYSPADLIQSKTLDKTPEGYAAGSVSGTSMPPHAHVALRMREADHPATPQPGDRVPFIVVRDASAMRRVNAKGQATRGDNIGARAYHPIEYMEGKYVYDHAHYTAKVIKKLATILCFGVSPVTFSEADTVRFLEGLALTMAVAVPHVDVDHLEGTPLTQQHFERAGAAGLRCHECEAPVARTDAHARHTPRGAVCGACCTTTLVRCCVCHCALDGADCYVQRTAAGMVCGACGRRAARVGCPQCHVVACGNHRTKARAAKRSKGAVAVFGEYDSDEEEAIVVERYACGTHATEYAAAQSHERTAALNRDLEDAVSACMAHMNLSPDHPDARVYADSCQLETCPVAFKRTSATKALRTHERVVKSAVAWTVGKK